MLDPISATQYACYLTDVAWTQLVALAQRWAGDRAQVLQDADPTLEVKGDQGRFRVERYALKPEQQPWEFLLTFTRAKAQSPLDAWQQVQFARKVALATGGSSFCDLPPELGKPDPAFYWQLRLTPKVGDVEVAILRLAEQDGEKLDLLEATSIDLRNFELYQLFS